MFNSEMMPRFKKKQTRQVAVFVEGASSVQIGELTRFSFSISWLQRTGRFASIVSIAANFRGGGHSDYCGPSTAPIFIHTSRLCGSFRDSEEVSASR